MKYDQRRFKLMFEHITKSIVKEDADNILTIKAGTELFHGTIEKFDKKNTSVGGYDKIFWTTTDPAISQTYISRGGMVYCNTESISYPTDSKELVNFQKSIGIDYDYSKVKFNRQYRNGVESYSEAPIFVEASNKEYHLNQEWYKVQSELNDLKKHLESKHWSKQTDEEFKRYEELEELSNTLYQKYKDNKVEKIKNEFVNNKLIELGYKPTQTDGMGNGNHSWKIMTDNDQVHPADYKSMGRLLIVTPKRDLKIWDTTEGGRREGDLGDVDYHKHDWFRTAEKNGYDGIKITDFAQSADMGNVDHFSIGLFKNTLKDVNIEEVDAQHHNLRDYHSSGNYHTPEYKNYKAKQNGGIQP